MAAVGCMQELATTPPFDDVAAPSLAEMYHVMLSMQALLHAVAEAVGADQGGACSFPRNASALSHASTSTAQQQVLQAIPTPCVKRQLPMGCSPFAKCPPSPSSSSTSSENHTSPAIWSRQLLDAEGQHGMNTADPDAGMGGGCIEDRLCAMGALQAFGTNSCATISVTDFIATTRALELEANFVSCTGKLLCEENVETFFSSKSFEALDINARGIPFGAFHNALTELAQGHTSSASNTITDAGMSESVATTDSDPVAATFEESGDKSCILDGRGEHSIAPAEFLRSSAGGSHDSFPNTTSICTFEPPDATSTSIGNTLPRGTLELQLEGATWEQLCRGEEVSLEWDGESQISTADAFSMTTTAYGANTNCGWSNVGMDSQLPSLFTTQSFDEVHDAVRKLGGHYAILHPASHGPLECIVVESPAKRLDPTRFVTTGVVICLHGMPPSRQVLEEWGEVLRRIGWLDLGLCVALPNLQMSAALQQKDIEAVVEATLHLVNCGRCVIVGKCWGAQRAVELAAVGRLAGRIDSVILVAPSSPVPEACTLLAVPVLLAWAEDDDTSSFEDAEGWLHALSERKAPTLLQVEKTGGHRLDRLLADVEVAAAISRFTVATMVLGALKAGAWAEAGPWRHERFSRLNAKLPSFLQIMRESCRHTGWGSGQDGRVDDEEFSDLVSAGFDIQNIRHLLATLPQWISAGVPTDTE